MDKRRAMKMESLERQMDLMQTLEDHHMLWARDTSEPEVKSRHMNIANIFRQAGEQCLLLLELYQHQSTS